MHDMRYTYEICRRFSAYCNWHKFFPCKPNWRACGQHYVHVLKHALTFPYVRIHSLAVFDQLESCMTVS